jgi:flagellar biosynthesis protein FlhG
LSPNGGPRTITITSGKGGVGKTSISVNLALHLAALGYRTCLFDADLGLANINILLGLSPEYNLEDVISSRHSLQDVIIKNYKGMDVIPGSSGVEKMANLEGDQVDHLVRSFSELDGYDFLLFDTSAGVSRNVIAFCLASSEVVLIITPEPTSLTDAYAVLKILTLNGFNGTVRIVVNQCKTAKIANLAYSKFKETVQRYLRVDLMPLGMVLQDSKVVEAIKAQQALILLYPESNASKCIKHITKNILEHRPEPLEAPGMTSFWTKCLQLIKSPLNLTSPQKGVRGIEPAPSTEQVQKGLPQQAQETEQESVPEESPGESPEESPDKSMDTRQPQPVQALPKAAEEEATRPQGPEKEDPAVKTTDLSEPGRTACVDQDMSLLIGTLIESISSVSQELRLIGKAIREGGGNGLGMNGLAGRRQEARDPKAITLDFEAFLERRGKNPREGMK